MCCPLLVAALIGPRVAFVLVWIFGERVQAAFGSWIWPLLLVVFLPWTGLAYVLVWSAVGGVAGWEWIVVGIGFLLDLGSHSRRSARRAR